jgi:hypothetical protein
VAELGWQSHTMCAALSGLRKSGISITHTSGDGGPIYVARLGSAESVPPATSAPRPAVKSRPRKTPSAIAGAYNAKPSQKAVVVADSLLTRSFRTRSQRRLGHPVE